MLFIKLACNYLHKYGRIRFKLVLFYPKTIKIRNTRFFLYLAAILKRQKILKRKQRQNVYF